jgi:hypothetical protein
MNFALKNIFSLFILIIGMNMIIPVDFQSLLDDGIALEQLSDFDSEENDEEERENEKEIEAEDYFIDMDLCAFSHLSDSSQVLLEFQMIRLNIYIDIDTPPPLA